MNPGGGSKGGYGEPQPAGYGQPITPPPAYGQPAPSYTYGNPDTMPTSSQPQHTAITVVQAPQVITWKHCQKFGKDNRNTSQQFGREPMHTFCPNCQKNVCTTTTKKTGQSAYLWALVLCCCWWFHGICNFWITQKPLHHLLSVGVWPASHAAWTPAKMLSTLVPAVVPSWVFIRRNKLQWEIFSIEHLIREKIRNFVSNWATFTHQLDK